ncbi:MAG: tetratricopeptide repeat protein [Phycisphaerales bacterium]|nr:tetratricopeptide repeat protein [Phycisphaerales bacterium]
MTESTLDLPTIFEQSNFSAEHIDTLKRIAFSSKESANRFRELLSQAESTAGSSGGNAALRVGVSRLMLGQPQQAVSWLEKSPDNADKQYHLAIAYREVGRFADAAKAFEAAAGAGADRMECKCLAAECHLLMGETSETRSMLEAIAGDGSASADWHYVMGRVLFEEGDRSGAIASMERALEIDELHSPANFHLGTMLHLYGDDDGAKLHFSMAAEDSGCYANALMNLAICYEDEGRYERAASCVRRVLVVDPAHERARLFLRDLESAHDMYIDEQEVMDSQKRNAVLDIPVTDFELSVRSRNCLKKMNINTLGDLLRTTEPELLAYKNFGETSLKEIKAMLSHKGLSLGQLSHEKRNGGSVGIKMPTIAPAPGVSADVYNRSVATLELSVRSRKCLQVQGINTVGELTQRTETELMASRNFGQTSLNEIKGCLSELGVSLRPSDA